MKGSAAYYRLQHSHFNLPSGEAAIVLMPHQEAFAGLQL